MKRTLPIYFLVLSVIGILTSCSPASLPIPSIRHNIESITELSEAWVLNSVYILQDGFGTITGTADGRFCFLGNLSNQAVQKIICLDAVNGSILWEKPANSASAFAISPDGVFLGSHGGFPGVVRYNLAGEFIWDYSFTGNGVIRIYVVGNEIQVFNHPEKLRIFDVETGNAHKGIEGDTIFIATESEIFLYTYTLQLVDPNTKMKRWEADIKGFIRMAPFFTKDVIYIRTGEIMGRAYAIDRDDGRTLWKTDDNIVSNIVYSPEKERAYVLTQDGKLLGIDTNSGITNTLIQFSNAPFILNGEQQVGGYEVSYDESTNMLFVTLGDSCQLFAFREK